MRKILITTWNIISMILLLILKGIACIVVYPLEALGDFIRVLHVLISIVSYFFAVIFLFGAILDSDDKTNFIINIFILFLFVMFPFSIKLLSRMITEHMVIYLKDFISDTPLKAWNIRYLRSVADEAAGDNDGSYYEDSHSNDDYDPEPQTTSSGFDASALFSGITDKDTLKKRYRDLLKIYHPDNMNGSTIMTQQIQDAYELILAQNNW